MIKNIEVLAEKLKGIKVGGEDFTPDVFKTAFESDKEVDLVVPEGSFLSDNQIEELKQNIVTGSMRDGVISGAEQLSKAIKRSTGLDFEGKNIIQDRDSGVNFDASAKDIGKLLAEKISTDLKLPQDKKVRELESSLENLQNTVEKNTSDWDTEKQEWQSKLSGFKIDNFISTHAQGVDGHKPAHLVAAFLTDGFSVRFEEGGPIPTLHDKPMKDNLEKLLNFEDVFNDWKKKNNFVSDGKGRGGGNEPVVTVGGSSKFESMNDVYKHMEKNNISPVTDEGIKLIADFKASQKKT